MLTYACVAAVIVLCCNCFRPYKLNVYMYIYVRITTHAACMRVELLLQLFIRISYESCKHFKTVLLAVWI